MFFGTFERHMEKSGRIALPPQFISEPHEIFILAKGVKACIVAYRLRDWDKLAVVLVSKPLPSAHARQMDREISVDVVRVQIDKKRRITLPSRFRQFANIQDEVIIVGFGENCFEIWDNKRWKINR